jgi:hypothetical protein
MNEPNFGWGLPPGVSDRDIDGPEERDDDGLTYRERCEEEKGEAKADCEREE